jgi:TfoX/Sxy family transcriptional regulator of competence genes
MPYSEALADRVRHAIGPDVRVTEIKMFGGLCFMVRGHMTCGIMGDHLMLRLGADGAASALARPHTRPMDFTGKPMVGMIYVDPSGCSTARSVRTWIDRALEHNAGKPEKAKPSRRRRSPVGKTPKKR